jgi:FkbM family methyltransferase
MTLHTAGSWLYGRSKLAWLSDPALVRQLPRPYRFFARYCAGHSFEPVGAEILLRGIMALQRRRQSQDSIVPLVVGDITVFLDLQDPRFLRIPAELSEFSAVLRHFLQPGDTFIDAGANHGTFSIVASRLVGPEGLVVSIEPQPRLAGLLLRLLEKGPAKFEIHQIACGNCSDNVPFYIPSATSGSAGLLSAYSARFLHRTIQVAIRRLDDVIDSCSLPGRTLIKLDVEGSELAVLLGARRLIQAIKPALLIEINPRTLRAAGTSKESLLGALLDLGYHRFVTPQNLDFEQTLNVEIPDGDLVFLPPSVA